MTFSIGRQVLDDPETWPTSGNSIALAGDYFASSVAAGVQARENLRWMVGTVQPVVWTEDDTKTGFYRVTNVGTEDTEVTLDTGHFRWSASLEPLPHHRALEVEATCRGADRANAPSTSVPWYAVPDETLSLNYGHGSLTLDSRDGVSGTVQVITGVSLHDRFVRWTIDPANYLNMAAKVEFDGAVVVGNQSTLDPMSVAISNDILKISIATGANTLQVQAPNGAAWGTAAGCDVGFWNGASLTAFDPDDLVACRVLRNDPELCSVRWMRYSGGVARSVDVTLRRGAVIAEILISQESGYADTAFGIQLPACATVHTTRTLRSGTVEGNYRAILCDQLNTQVSASGLMYASSNSDQLRVGVGTVLGAGSATGENDMGSLRDQFFAAQMITERFSGVRQ